MAAPRRTQTTLRTTSPIVQYTTNDLGCAESPEEKNTKPTPDAAVACHDSPCDTATSEMPIRASMAVQIQRGKKGRSVSLSR